jgi:hypothetical protein
VDEAAVSPVDLVVTDTGFYVGQPIIGPESFLRRFPQIVAVKQRLAFDAMVMASDIVDLSYKNLRELAAEVGPDTSQVGPSGITRGIAACWSIVDQMHALAQIIRSEIGTSSVGPKTQKLLDSLATATRLRNKMDHLKDNLGNLATQRGPSCPLFGSLSYVFVIDTNTMSACAIALHSGALINEQVVPIVNPVDRQILLPAGLFQLTAFGITLEFEPVMLLLSQHFARQAAHFELQIREAASAHALSHGLDVEELMASACGGFGIAMFIGLGSPEIDSSEQV